MEAGDRIRALIVEMREFISVSGRNWEKAACAPCPQLHLSDRMSPVNRLNSDKRLEIEMSSMRQSLRDEDENVEMETFEKFPDGGDKILRIHTSTMPDNCLTKRMKLDLFLKVLHTNRHCAELTRKEKKAQESGWIQFSQFHTCKAGCVWICVCVPRLVYRRYQVVKLLYILRSPGRCPSQGPWV